MATSRYKPLMPSGGDDVAAILAAAALGQPLGPGTFKVSTPIGVQPNTNIIGNRARGTAATIIQAQAGGTWTGNGRSTFPAIMKWNGGDQWAHGVNLKNIRFDTNGIAGLSATWFQSFGEVSDFDNLVCDTTTATARTVTDAQITSGNVVITFTASTVTEDDVNAFITDRTDGDHTQAGPTIPAWTRIDRINYAAPVTDTTATSITIQNAPTGSAANSSFTIKRPTDAFVWDGGGARGQIGSLNGINIPGALLRLKNFNSGTLAVRSLSGDDNQGLLRISQGSHNVDPVSIYVEAIKSESDTYNTNFRSDMDPCILLDRCVSLSLHIASGSFLAYTNRDVIRLDQCNIGAGPPPSIQIDGIEGQNWYNTAYQNIIRDTATGETLSVSAYNASAYPTIFWNREVHFGGLGKAPRYERWVDQSYFISQPVWMHPVGTATFVSAQGAPVSYAGGGAWYNISSTQNDGLSWLADISPGTYDLRMIAAADPAGAIITIDAGIHVWNAPAQPVAPTQPAAGTFPAGANYSLYKTYVTANGETYVSPSRIFTAADSVHNLVIASPATPLPYFNRNPIIGWYAYLAAAGTSTPAYRQQTTPTPLGTSLTISGAPTLSGTTTPIADTSGIWTSISTTWDTYAAAKGLTVTPQYTGIVIPNHDGPVRLRFRSTSRNASNTTGYIMILSGYHWQRTA